MNRSYSILLCIILILSAFTVYQWTLPSPQKKDYEGFSSARVVEDLKVIAHEPHSVAHVEARTAVYNYLKEKLKSLGGNLQTYHYPSQKAKGYTFDANNIVAEFPPLKESKDTTYLLLIAHYDSKYPMKRKQRIVSSFGAGDDGYGVGVILECLYQVLKDRKDWTQGIRVLFTDAEEVGMIGMKAAYKYNKEIFKNVGLAINVEARGTYGPVLLFETSPGNKQLMELYGNYAQYPYTYSLTSVVYKFMPNDTDFTIIKDTIPGFNFSVIADVNHYHTELDHLDNINEVSIQHYGEQIVPIITHYLINPIYKDKDYFSSKEDTVYFTIPLLGFFNCSKGYYQLSNIVIFILFLFTLYQKIKKQQFKFSSLIKQSGILITLSLGMLVIGELIAWFCAHIAGIYFKPFGNIGGIPFDNEVMVIAIGLMSITTILYYTKCQLYHSPLTLYSILSILFIYSLLLLLTFGENMMFFIPLACTTIALTLEQITSLRIFSWIAVVIISLHAFSFIYILAMALTIGALGIVMMLAFYDVMILLAISMYNTQREKLHIPK